MVSYWLVLAAEEEVHCGGSECTHYTPSRRNVGFAVGNCRFICAAEEGCKLRSFLKPTRIRYVLFIRVNTNWQSFFSL